MDVHVYIEVTDLGRGVNFYRNALGLSVRRQLDSDWVELQGASVPVYLLSDRPPVADLGGHRVKRNFSRHWTPVHLDFIVADLERSIETARAAGAVLEREVQIREWGRMANMADLFGNGFDLIEFNASGYAALTEAS